jgi:hypothetical protein
MEKLFTYQYGLVPRTNCLPTKKNIKKCIQQTSQMLSCYTKKIFQIGVFQIIKCFDDISDILECHFYFLLEIIVIVRTILSLVI